MTSWPQRDTACCQGWARGGGERACVDSKQALPPLPSPSALFRSQAYQQCKKCKPQTVTRKKDETALSALSALSLFLATPVLGQREHTKKTHAHTHKTQTHTHNRNEENSTLFPVSSRNGTKRNETVQDLSTWMTKWFSPARR